MKSRFALMLVAILATGCGVSAVAPNLQGADTVAEVAAPRNAAPRYQTQAQTVDPPAIVPVGLRYHGKSYDDLVAGWWNWAFNQPFEGHPLLDTTGEDAATGQKGDIWFLGGIFGGFGLPETVTRHVEIPEGKALFFPIINTEGDASDCGGGTFDFPFEAAYAHVVGRIDTATGLSATIDGMGVEQLGRFRVNTGPFTMIYGPTSETNLTSQFCGGGPGYRGTFREAASSGYWLLVEPLAVGHHTINFKGTLPGAFSLDVTYEIDVI